MGPKVEVSAPNELNEAHRTPLYAAAQGSGGGELWEDKMDEISKSIKVYGFLPKKLGKNILVGGTFV